MFITTPLVQPDGGRIQKTTSTSSIEKVPRYGQLFTDPSVVVTVLLGKSLPLPSLFSMMNTLGPEELLLDITSSCRNYAFTTSNLTSSQHV